MPTINPPKTPGAIKCKCGGNFKRTKELRGNEPGELVFICNQCGRVFRRARTERNHITISEPEHE